MIKKNMRFKLSPLISVLALLSSASYAGQNFIISPNGPQPSVITPGSPVVANYLLTNMTSSTRAGYSIQGLPSTVTQDTTSGNCPGVITLPAKGSCNLVFNITGPVSSNFAICRGNSCTTASQPLNVSELGRMISGGTYCGTAGCLPLLTQFASGTWVYPSTIVTNLPAGQGYTNPTIHSNACSGTFCVAAGNDTSNSGYLPFIAISPTGVDDWTYPIAAGTGTYPSDISGNFGDFVGSGCADPSWCVVSGRYFATTLSDFPLVAQYLNGVWTYPISSANPPTDLFNEAILSSASCTGNTCIAAGTYEDSSGYALVLAQSMNHGATWSYAIDDDTGPQPTGENNNSRFLEASCNGSMCIAVGDYVATDSDTYALVAQTQNSGASYSYPIDSTHGPLGAFYVNAATFNAASCSSRICIAAGSYVANTGDSNNTYGYLVQSTNHGVSWTIGIDALTGPAPSNFQVNAVFSAASCSATRCIAAGSYLDNDDFTAPYLVQSTDAGATWTIAIDDTIGPQPAGFSGSGSFATATCIDNTCFAAGQYTSASTVFPMLAVSIDNGPWTYAIDSTLSTLPIDFTNDGRFEGSAAGQALKKQMNNIKGHKK